jgi:hypothetical protein
MINKLNYPEQLEQSPPEQLLQEEPVLEDLLLLEDILKPVNNFFIFWELQRGHFNSTVSAVIPTSKSNLLEHFMHW